LRNDIKPLFEWAVANGEAKIVDRILMKLMPQFLKEGHRVTSAKIEDLDSFEVSDELYSLVKEMAEEFVGDEYV
jgi:uncharacterized protein YfeS